VPQCLMASYDAADFVHMRSHTRNSSGDDIASVNFFYDKFTSTTFTQCAPKDTECAEITQNNGQYAVQGHSRSPIMVPIESSYASSY